MPLLEDTDQTEMTNNSDFAHAELRSEEIEDQSVSPATPQPRRSTRNTKG